MEKTLINTKTRQRILLAAREEFIAYGFRDASLRTIAKEAGITVSNIYNYFNNKDELFRAVLSPLLEAFELMLKQHNSEENMEKYMNTPQRFQDATVKEFLKLTHNFRTELKLLFFHAGGSSLEHYKENITRQQFEISFAYLRSFKEKYPQANENISPFFIRICCTWWIIIFSEIVADDTLSEEELEQGLRDYIIFGTAGWKELMHI